MEFLDVLLNYIIGDALILIPALSILGIFLKRTPKIQDWLIPWILLVVGIVFSLAIIGLSVHGFVQGILVTGGAVLIHQAYKQTKNKE